jgi:hypothetical protein
MRFISMIAVLFFFVIASSNAQSQNYTLKRITITWDGGIIEDSAIGPISAHGTMTINGNLINQHITICYFGSCDHVVDNGGGTIVDVAANAARVTVRRVDDGTLGDLTILSLSPNIIEMYVYDDGTVETHEWEPVF